MARSRVKSLPGGGTSGQIGIKDPFELIRHLARSQGDPRKAVAELVQNALDEQATRIVLDRRREGSDPVLSILDDGRGVLPALPRDEALTAIAKNIGHSRKRDLTFDERMRQAMLGQYGIGLLGFWALGHELKMISRVADSQVWALTLFEDSPRFTVEPLPGDLGRAGTWTEVQVRRLHRAALGPTVGSRLATWLSVELRGQLIRHGTRLEIFDRLARGAAERHLVVTPSALVGEQLPGLGPIAVPGFRYPVELTLHFAGDADTDSGRLRLACAGAIVLDDVCELPELAVAPWNDSRLVGVIDFPHLEVPPGSRRGMVPNEAASALVDALRGVAPLVQERLDARAAVEAASLSRDVHKQLARLFTKVTDYVPHLSWFPVSKKSAAMADDAVGEGTGLPEAGEEADEASPQRELLPPGPLSQVVIRPAAVELARGAAKTVRARALDVEGRRVREGVSFTWSSEGLLRVTAEGSRAMIEALEAPGSAKLIVEARQGDVVARAELPVALVEEAAAKKADAGIPQPEELNEPLQTWRSRLADERWQINTGHADYRALSTEQRPRLRYLASLLAKEVVSRNFPQPGVGAILEELVGLLAALERSGAWTPGRTPKE